MAIPLLITVQEVIDLAFIGEENIKTDRILDSVIRSAQEKYLKETFCGLYGKFLEGEYADFVSDYIKPPLAFYVRYLAEPNMSIQMSNMGAFLPQNDFSKAATDRQRDTLRQSSLMIAEPLIDAALGYIRSHNDDFPEFEKQIKKTKEIIGGIVI